MAQPWARRGVQHREVQLVIPRNKIQEQVLDHRYHLRHAGFRAVNLVYDDNRLDVLLEGLAQNVGSLWHGAVDGVHQQQAAVGHIHDAFHLAAEVGVARRVDDVDPDTAVGDRGVLARIVIPRSRSSGLVSIIRAPTCWWSRKTCPCFNSASTRVVLPWSTWAMMARLRMASF